MVKKRSYLKIPKTAKGKMNLIRELIGGKREYPPSEEVWQQILDVLDEKAQPESLAAVQERIRRETNRYKPSLPEPLLARVYHHGVYYYLDPRNNLYEGDSGNVLVGNLVGHIKEEIDPETKKSVIKVFLKGQELMAIPRIDVEESEMYGRMYYKTEDKKVYRGLHPGHNYIYLVGKLNHENKISLI